MIKTVDFGQLSIRLLVSILMVILVWQVPTATPAQSVSLETVYSFNYTDGSTPFSELVQASDGNFYGTTRSGGAYGYGIVFRLTSEGGLVTLHSFNRIDGAYPTPRLLQVGDGNFYGTTRSGGARGYGTVFRLTSEGELVTLHSFGDVDGAGPGELIQASDGNFYGTTFQGGQNACDLGCGTVFRITGAGEVTTLHTFSGGSDGYLPYGTLLQASDGLLYGSTRYGGAGSCETGCGTVFKLTTAGDLVTLYTFSGGNDGASPDAGLTETGAGEFYGTTLYGGLLSSACSVGCGTVFRLTRTGELTTLHVFKYTDGANPDAGLLQAGDGNFYSTTIGGGASDSGTVFRLTSGGELTTLYAFSGGSDGRYAYASLIQAGDGNFYSTTPYGGSGYGTVFRLRLPRAVPTGDFNSDGYPDILWRNGSTGANVVWLMNGTSFVSTAYLPTITDLNWQIEGVGDFNGDSKPDIVGRDSATGTNVVWLMNGTSFVSTAYLPTVTDLNWHIEGVGDFNGDSKPDIVGRDSATGTNVIWLMNGTSFVSTVALPSVTNLDWRIGSIGNSDFNGDGQVDIVWRNESTGANVIWLMNGTSFVSTVTLPTVTNLDWQIRATGDLSGDGRPDIIWRNGSTGANVVWLMNGTSFVSTVTLPTVTNLDWQMHGPR